MGPTFCLSFFILCVSLVYNQLKCLIYLCIVPYSCSVLWSLIPKWLAIRYVTAVAPFPKSLSDGSWCTGTSFTPLPVKLPQVLKWTLLDSPLKTVVITVAYAPFSIKLKTIKCLNTAPSKYPAPTPDNCWISSLLTKLSERFTILHSIYTIYLNP